MTGLLRNPLKRDIYGLCAKAYKKKLLKEYNKMQIFGQTKPKPLTDIYIDVNILEQLTHLQKYTAEEMNEVLSRESRFGHVRETRPGIDLINACSKLTILGKPGAGKTTFLKLVTIEAAKEELDHKVLPIFIGLKAWSDSGKELFDYIVGQFDIFDFPGA